MEKKFFGYKAAVGAFLIIFVNLGVASTLGIFLASLSEYSGWSVAMCGYIGTANTIGNIVLSMVVAKALPKIGVRKCMFISIIGIVLHAWLYTFATPGQNVMSLVFYYLGGLICSFAITFGTHATCSTLIAKWFIEKREKITGIVLSGAGFGAALAILLGASYFGISASSFCFGLAAVFVAYLISRVSRTNPTTAMILAGMMISSLFSAGTSFIKLVADTDQKLPAITYWLLGSLTSIKQRDLLFLSIPFAVGMLPLLLLRWRLNLLTVGEDEARAMGVNTTLLRLIVVICATLLTAASVSVSGMIGWVGLIIPHICRMLFGYDYRRLIPASAMLGAAFLLVVDDAARLVTTNEIPLGILTAFIGAPLFLYLILSGGGRHAD